MAGRVVVVTGASSGIGRATATLLHAQGARVVLVSRSSEALTSAREELLARNASTATKAPPVLLVPTDVGDAAAVRTLFEDVVRRLGRVDAVVHCAATIAYGRFEDVPQEVFDAAVRTTLLGTANVARAGLEQFARQGGGSLVVVGSLLGKIATPYMSTYVTAKWGVHGLVRSLQVEARRTPGVHVSLVSPGGVDTPVYRQAGTYLGAHGRPPPPVVTPEKVARAVVHCIDHPARDANVGLGPSNALTVLGFRAAPWLYDAMVTPLMRLAGLSHDGGVTATPGNVPHPQPAGEAVRGGYGGGVRGAFGLAYSVRSIRVLPRVLGLTRSRSRNSATPSS